MTDFSDFDDFLTSQFIKEQQDESLFRLRLKQSHTLLQPFLQDVFTLFKDYNETILQPRKPHFVVFKRRQEISESDKKALFLYRINVLPRSLFASHFNPYTTEGASYVRPNVITEHDWYLKVALQFDLALTYTATRDAVLLPQITLRTWGTISSLSPLSADVEVSQEENWGKLFTTLTYQISQPHLPYWQQQLKELFMLTTPAVFSHTREIYGID